MPRRTALSPLLIGLLLAFVASPAFAEGERKRPEIRADKGGATRAKLDKGEILLKTRKVKGSPIPKATMRAVINAPPEKIWKIIERCARYTKTMQRVKESKELSRKGNVIICRVVIDMPWPVSDLTATTKAVHTVRPKRYYRRQWSLIKGDFKRNEGSWTLTPFDKEGKRTMVVYTSHAEPNISVPDWIQRAAAKSTLPKLIEHLRKQVGATK